MSKNQPPLDFGREYKAQTAWEELLEAFSDTVKVVGRKEAAYSLDVSPSDLSNALAERARRSVKASWTPWLIMADEHDRALKIYAGLKGYELTRKRTLTPEEKLALYRDRLRSFSPQLAAQLEEDIEG